MPGRSGVLPHAAVDRGSRRFALEAAAKATPEVAAAGVVQRKFARRQQSQALESIQRALRVRVEVPDAVDAIVEQVDAQRLRVAHGIHIEQGAAQCEFAGNADLGDGAVSGLGQLRARGRNRELLADGDIETAPGDEIGWRQALHQRLGADQHHAALQGRQAHQCRKAFGDQVRQGGVLVVGQDFPVRHVQHRQQLAGKERQFTVQLVQCARIRQHDDPGAVIGGSGSGDGQRAGAGVQDGPVDGLAVVRTRRGRKRAHGKAAQHTGSQGRAHVPGSGGSARGNQPPVATECTTCWYSK